jgi:hypothetical protein
VHKIKRNLRRRLNHAIKGNLKADKTFNLVGCDVAKLKAHLENQFDTNTKWGNYGSYWHIDHIEPCNNFDFRIEKDQKKCFITLI